MKVLEKICFGESYSLFKILRVRVLIKITLAIFCLLIWRFSYKITFWKKFISRIVTVFHEINFRKKFISKFVAVFLCDKLLEKVYKQNLANRFMNFIKKVFIGKSEEDAHRQFIRFGKGNYNRRALLSMWKTKNIKVKGSFEYANDFTLFIANLGEMKFSGNIWSKEEISGLSGKKKEGKVIYEVKDLLSSQIKKIAPQVYCFLLNADSTGVKLRIKAKLPKPGKGENKIDDKFCQMEIDEKYYNQVKEDFFWDLPDCKKAGVEHRFLITDITMPKGEKDYAKIREMAKRKGKIIRTANVDGKEIITEKAFEA